jgi:hypothetical protein
VQRNRCTAFKRNPHCGHGDHDHRSHDPREIDLIAIVALLFVTMAVFRFYNDSFSTPPSTLAFIVPSQSVHW